MTPFTCLATVRCARAASDHQTAARLTLNLGGLLNLAAEVVARPASITNGAERREYSRANSTQFIPVLSLLRADRGIYTLVASDQYGVATSESALVSLLGLLAVGDDNFVGGPLSILGTTTGSNVGATSEPGELLHAAFPAANRSGSPGCRC